MSGQMPSYTPLPTSIVPGTTAGHSTHHEKLNAMYNALGDMHYYGTGFPNNVVTAPVGSVYIDTAVTNGASSWIKKSGTGNTGWKVLEGDTGWRNISSLCNGTPVLAGGVWIRRIGADVFLSIVDFESTWAAAGWVEIVPPVTGFNHSRQWNHTTLVNDIARRANGSSGVMFRTYIGAALANGRSQASPVFSTDNAWPTTLPGTAV